MSQTTKEFLATAIAEAKAVKAAALANAKLQLEEAFMPQAEAILSKKLKEDMGFEEVLKPSDISAGKVGGSQKPTVEPKTQNAGQDTETWQHEGMEEEGQTISSQEIDEILAELAGDLEQDGNPAPEAPVDGAAPATPAPEAAPVDGAAPVAPVAPAPEAPVDGTPAPEAAPVPEAPKVPAAPSEEEPAFESVDDQEVDLHELLSSLSEEKEVGKEEEESCEKEEEEEGKITKEAYETVKSDLNEALDTVNVLRKQFNEVNLLNAKLLYTNKLFKQNSLTNEDKMKIVEAFDRTQTIREVKITYTNLAESFNFGKSTVKKTNTVVKTNTEGLASKAVASTKPAPSVIVENVNAQVNRFQELAGIKKTK
jgi:hypothetical protein